MGSALSTRWGARPVVMAGGVLTSLGLVFSAFARSLLHLYLGLGLLAGKKDGAPCASGARTDGSSSRGGGRKAAARAAEKR